jgi:putative radical SAM enzyme (TIGR03279 family)
VPIKSSGAEIEDVLVGSLAERHGIQAGDRLISLNGHKVADIIDLMFYGTEPRLDLLLERGGKRFTTVITNNEDEPGNLGIVLRHFKIKTCRNKCLFCFVAQLPKGMRRSLYVRDEDYRMSFLYGNYITLTNLSKSDISRIVGQRLSPLYISVHSTRGDTRNLLIGNREAPDILKELRFLADHRIRMHTQIVLCPGYNDGDLPRTIADLHRLYPYVMSIAVVPVGLTAHHAQKLRPVEKEDALRALRAVERLQARFKRRHGDLLVYASDELYLKAGVDLPPIEQYGDFPQIENGVGLVSLFLHEADRVKISPARHEKRFVIFTGVSFYPFLVTFVEKLRRSGVHIRVVRVENRLFGGSITVAGLLTGRDVLRTLSGNVEAGEVLLIPDVVMREGHETFLDDVSKQDVEMALGVSAVVIESSPDGLVKAVTPA